MWWFSGVHSGRRGGREGEDYLDLNIFCVSSFTLRDGLDVNVIIYNNLKRAVKLGR